MADWLAPVDDYLYATCRIGLEQVLCDGCLSGRVPEAVAAVASIEPELHHHRVTEEDGGASEMYRGALTVAGVRYFVASIGRFEPVAWSAGMRVA
jgi:hypothetical protein